MSGIEKGTGNVYADLGMLRGQFRGISESKMLDCLNRLGRNIEIVVRRPKRQPQSGVTRVVFA